MSKENETTDNSKPMAYDTLLASVISLGTNGMLQRLLKIRGYLIPTDYKRTDMALANRIITLEANI